MSVTLRGVTTPQEPTFQLASMAPPGRSRTPLIAAGVVGVLALMAATGIAVWFVSRPSPAPSAAPAATPGATGAREAVGTVVLQHSQFSWGGLQDRTCKGWKGFADIGGGTQVTVTDAGGKVLAIGTLDNGNATGITPSDANGLPRAEVCTLSFKVTGITPGVGPYGIEIAHRGVVRYEEGKLGIIQLGFNA